MLPSGWNARPLQHTCEIAQSTFVTTGTYTDRQTDRQTDRLGLEKRQQPRPIPRQDATELQNCKTQVSPKAGHTDRQTSHDPDVANVCDYVVHFTTLLLDIYSDEQLVETKEDYNWGTVHMVLKFDHFKEWLRNILKRMKCGSAERWKRSVGPIVWEMKCYRESGRKGVSYMQ